MKTQLLALSVGVVALILMGTMTPAQTANCGEHAKIIERLGARYGESRQSVGIAANRSLMEIYANDETGTWSILVTVPNGPTCLVASGMSFEALAAVAPQARGTAL